MLGYVPKCKVCGDVPRRFVSSKAKSRGDAFYTCTNCPHKTKGSYFRFEKHLLRNTTLTGKTPGLQSPPASLTPLMLPTTTSSESRSTAFSQNPVIDLSSEAEVESFKVALMPYGNKTKIMQTACDEFLSSNVKQKLPEQRRSPKQTDL